jgi:plasmid stabilization system protein ParE
MKAFELSPEAEEDVWSIWQYLAQEAGLAVADRVEVTLFAKMGILAGHARHRLLAARPDCRACEILFRVLVPDCVSS